MGKLCEPAQRSLGPDGLGCGERGIRTLDTPKGVYSLSRGALSTAQPSLRANANISGFRLYFNVSYLKYDIELHSFIESKNIEG